MKPSTILSTSTLLACAFASAAHPDIQAVAGLIARAIDPATMDPTKLSVLSVLKTAMPTPTGTGTSIALPTGNMAPQWYKNLPADVMVLLAQMYPATSTAGTEAASSAATVGSNTSSLAQEATSVSVSVSQTAATRTLGLVPTAAANSNRTLSTGESNGASVNSTLSGGEPSPTQSAISIGAKNTIGTGKWSVAVGLSVAAVFCFFA